MDMSSPKVMGILNVTPDSFFSGSRKQTEQEITERCNQIIDEAGEQEEARKPVVHACVYCPAFAEYRLVDETCGNEEQELPDSHSEAANYY